MKKKRISVFSLLLAVTVCNNTKAAETAERKEATLKAARLKIRKLLDGLQNEPPNDFCSNEHQPDLTEPQNYLQEPTKLTKSEEGLQEELAHFQQLYHEAFVTIKGDGESPGLEEQLMLKTMEASQLKEKQGHLQSHFIILEEKFNIVQSENQKLFDKVERQNQSQKRTGHWNGKSRRNSNPN